MACQPPSPRFILRCRESFDSFVLSEEGKTWTKDFTSMVAALTYAESRCAQPGELTILSEGGTYLTHYAVKAN